MTGLAIGGLFLVAAVLVVAWPAITVDALAVVAGIGLLAGGVLELAAPRPRRSSLRGPAGRSVRAAASVIFGVLILVWPDVAILAIAVGFGVRVILFGAGVIARALSDRRTGWKDRAPSRLLHGFDLIGRSLLFALALVLLVGSVYLHREPARPGAFYTPPQDVPAEPGRLIRSQPYTHGMLAGTRGWLILYTTTDVAGVRADRAWAREVMQRVGLAGRENPAAAAWADRVVFLADGQIVTELADPTAEKVAAQVMAVSSR